MNNQTRPHEKNPAESLDCKPLQKISSDGLVLDLYKNLEERLIDSITSRSYEIYAADDSGEDIDMDTAEWQNEGVYDEGDAIPLLDEEDISIFLEREVHFSGSFPLMIDYYENEDNKGINEEISLSRIYMLYEIEKEMLERGKSLAPLILQGRDAEKIQVAKAMYKSLADLLAEYSEILDPKAETRALPPAVILAEAIVSEEPVDLLVSKYTECFRGSEHLLRSLISSHIFYDRLSPGYGLAPLFAIKVLAELKDEGSLPLFFDRLFQLDEMNEDINEALLIALKSIGEPAKKKALSLLKDPLLSRDKEKSLFILIEFLPDTEISSTVFKLLRDSDTLPPDSLLQYYILLLESLPASSFQELLGWIERNRMSLSVEIADELACLVRNISKMK